LQVEPGLLRIEDQQAIACEPSNEAPQSRPEPTRTYITGGKRDLSFDLDLPQPIAWYRPTIHAELVIC
jgi:hypothetical protein